MLEKKIKKPLPKIDFEKDIWPEVKPEIDYIRRGVVITYPQAKKYV